MNLSRPRAPLFAPPFLKKGARIRLVAPSGAFQKEHFEAGCEIVRAAGFEPVFSNAIFGQQRYLAGPDGKRLADFADALADPNVEALWNIRGGYGATRIAADIADLLAMSQHRWWIGFSDATALHAVWALAGRASLHGANITTLPTWSSSARDGLFALLEGSRTPSWPATVLQGSGAASGPLLGGNLTVLGALVGTGLLPDFSGSIVLLEDVGERPYRLDRTMTQLLQAGVFRGVSAFILGQFVGCEDDGASYTAEDVVAECLGELGKMVVRGLPVGHDSTSESVMMGVSTIVDGFHGRVTQAIRNPGAYSV